MTWQSLFNISYTSFLLGFTIQQLQYKRKMISHWICMGQRCGIGLKKTEIFGDYGQLHGGKKGRLTK